MFFKISPHGLQHTYKKARSNIFHHDSAETNANMWNIIYRSVFGHHNLWKMENGFFSYTSLAFADIRGTSLFAFVHCWKPHSLKIIYGWLGYLTLDRNNSQVCWGRAWCQAVLIVNQSYQSTLFYVWNPNPCWISLILKLAFPFKTFISSKFQKFIWKSVLRGECSWTFLMHWRKFKRPYALKC